VKFCKQIFHSSQKIYLQGQGFFKGILGTR